MRFNLLQDWLSWLETAHPINEIELGLERTQQVAHNLNITSSLNNKKVVTVAGTNGKGSCVAALHALLRSHSLHVGCFTSPHFIRYNERIVIDDSPVSDACLIESFDRVDRARGGIALTYFEFGTLVALDIFQRNHLDVVILEVGLGGRLDAVNIIDPSIAIITSIDLDHTDWLGSTREAIGQEKAGIFRPSQLAICADPNPPESIRTYADKLGTQLLQRPLDFDILINKQSGRCYWQGLNVDGDRLHFEFSQLTLPVGSVAAALQAFLLLNLPQADNHYHCLENLTLAGRFQFIDPGDMDQHGQVILDVAHNPAAALHLANQLNCTPVQGQTFALIAMMQDKDSAAVIDALINSIDVWYIADLSDNPRAMSGSDLAALINKYNIEGVSVNNNVKQAYQKARTAMNADDRLIVFGSFITVSEVMKILHYNHTVGESV